MNGRPGKGRENIDEVEAAWWHRHYSRDHWNEAAHAWSEAGKENALAAVPMDECAALVDQARIAIERPAPKDRLPVTVSKPVRQPVAQDCTNDGGDH